MFKRFTLIVSFVIFITDNALAGALEQTGPIVGGAAAAVGANAAAAGSLSAQCAANKLACIMAALSIAQMAKSMTTGKGGQQAAKSLTSPVSYASTDFGGGLTGAMIDDKIAFAESQLSTAQKNLKKVAPNIDLAKGTVETPKGKVPLSSLGSGAAMAKAGLADPSQIAEIDAQLKKMNEFKIPSMSGSTGGGGGGSGGSGKSAQYAMPSFEMPHEPGEKLAAPVAAGLVKLANGEPIGTASDDIFNMIHNRYQKKVQEKIFVGQGDSTN